MYIIFIGNYIIMFDFQVDKRGTPEFDIMEMVFLRLKLAMFFRVHSPEPPYKLFHV